MEKHTPHYPLAEIQVQMTTVPEMNLTVSAKIGIREVGMAQADALAVVQGGCPQELLQEHDYPCRSSRLARRVSQAVARHRALH